MQLALVGGKKVEAFSGGKGVCPVCGVSTIAKCGPRIMHHWAHFRLRDCDPWWENETLWHREWKNRFPVSCREITHIDDNGEIHRADIKTPSGIYIEVQHSNMTDQERISRENFYKNLIWIVDGRGFRNNFDIYHMLPDPRSELASDLIWFKAKRHMYGSNTGLFVRLSEALEDDPLATKASIRGGIIHGIYDIKEELESVYSGHHQYDWVRPRKTWLESKCPVYIDFGDNFLVKLGVYDESGLNCIRLVCKRKFVYDAMREKKAEDIATKFFPFSE